MPRKRRYPLETDPPQPQGGILEMIQADPLVWLFAIDVPSTPASKYRLAAHPKQITFERDSTGAAIVYSPGSIMHREVQADTEGSIPSVSLTLQNVTREAIAVLESYDGLVGQKVRICAVRLSEMPDGNPISDEVYDVVDTSATEADVQFTLGRQAITSRKFPELRVSRTHCQWQYGGPGCGYDTTRAGALTSCDKTPDGPNGCEVHGDDEEDASVTRRHPQRILIFQGTPTA